MAVGTKPRTGEGAAAAAPAPAGGERRLFLIDGPSLVYRAFFALPESIATSTGEPTNAIFGFASMLVKIVTEYGVCPTLVVWDAGTSGRSEVYPEYKAQRRSRPDLLKQQWPAMEPLVEAFGYANVSVEGFEADDVIASLAARAAGSEPPVPVMIVTGDRDALQLVDERGLIKVMATSRGITETKVYDRQAVIDRYGIPPELIPDFYGLKGDTSDNIPGVPGIGEKTASELIRSHGTLEEVLAHVDDISGPKRKQNLLEHAEDARLSKRLATVQRDLDVDVDLAAEAARDPDRASVREFFRRYELRDPLRRLEEALGRSRRRRARRHRRGDAHRDRPRGLGAGRRPPAGAGRAGGSGGGARGPGRGAVRRGCGVALRGRPRRRGPDRRLRRRRGARVRVRRASRYRPRRQGVGSGSRPARARHAAGGLPARAREEGLPARRAHRGAGLRELAGGPPGGWGGDAGGAGGLAARADRRARSGAGDGGDRAAAGAGAPRHGAARGSPQRRAPGGDNRSRAGRALGAGSRDLRARRDRVPDRLAPAAGGDPVREARPVT